jgi:hypothetical protein
MKPSPERLADSQAQGKGGDGKTSVSPPTLIFAGFARLPANAATPHGGGVLAIELEVDPYDMRVVDAACNCLPSLGQKFLVELLVGSRLEDGLAGIVEEIRSRYVSIAQRAMIAALEDVFKRYDELFKSSSL